MQMQKTKCPIQLYGPESIKKFWTSITLEDSIQPKFRDRCLNLAKSLNIPETYVQFLMDSWLMYAPMFITEGDKMPENLKLPLEIETRLLFINRQREIQSQKTWRGHEDGYDSLNVYVINKSKNYYWEKFSLSQRTNNRKQWLLQWSTGPNYVVEGYPSPHNNNRCWSIPTILDTTNYPITELPFANMHHIYTYLFNRWDEFFSPSN